MIKGERVRSLRKDNGYTQKKLSEKINSNIQTIGKIENNRIKDLKVSTLEKLADVFNTSTDYLTGRSDISSTELFSAMDQSNVFEIPVYGKIPAGQPIEALEVDLGYVPVAKDMMRDRQLIGLKVIGDSMYPKYMEGDIIIIEITPDVHSGEDIVAFIGYEHEATLKRFRRMSDHIELEPLNREYPIKKFYPNDRKKVRVLGRVIEIRRAV